jgi:hypothetical protein
MDDVFGLDVLQSQTYLSEVIFDFLLFQISPFSKEKLLQRLFGAKFKEKNFVAAQIFKIRVQLHHMGVVELAVDSNLIFD